MTVNNWPIGLQNIFLRNLDKIALRYFIIDDSGSMCASDGHKYIGTGLNKKRVGCSRWAELGNFVKFHAGLVSSNRINKKTDPCIDVDHV